MKLILTIFLLAAGVMAPPENDKLISEKVNEIMASMTLEEKVSQLFVIQIDRNNTEEEQAEQDSLVKMGVGGVIIMRGPVGPFVERAYEMQKNSRIPLLECTDAEWGAAMRFYEYAPYPKQFQISKIPNAEPLLYKMGRNVAKELKDLGILVNFAPVVDTGESTDENANQRKFSFGRERICSYSDAYMRGMQDEGISACAKHFPSHGDTDIDAHVEMPVFNYTIEHMDSTYLTPYKKLISGGVDFIMVGHYGIPSIDSTLTPTSISESCIKGLLRERLGFEGLVITDALRMGGVASGRTPLEVNLAAYKAGIDLLLMTEETARSIKAITDSLATGVFPMEDLDNRVRKILTLKAKRGFFEKGYNPQVKGLERKIRRAHNRDTRLIKRMNKEIEKAGKATEDTGFDPTLILDRGRD